MGELSSVHEFESDLVDPVDREQQIRNAWQRTEEISLLARESAFAHRFAQEIGAFIVETENWMRKSSCKGLGKIFFAPAQFESKDEKQEREGRAKAICSTCPVVKECRDYAFAKNEKHGVLGGMSESERKKVSR